MQGGVLIGEAIGAVAPKVRGAGSKNCPKEAPTPKAPTPKAPTPKTPKPKTPKGRAPKPARLNRELRVNSTIWPPRFVFEESRLIPVRRHLRKQVSFADRDEVEHTNSLIQRQGRYEQSGFRKLEKNLLTGVSSSLPVTNLTISMMLVVPLRAPTGHTGFRVTPEDQLADQVRVLPHPLGNHYV